MLAVAIIVIVSSIRISESSVVLVANGVMCAERLPFVRGDLNASSPPGIAVGWNPALDAHERQHAEWLMRFSNVSGSSATTLLEIQWNFASGWKSMRQRFVDAIAVGESVAWTITSPTTGAVRNVTGEWRFSSLSGDLTSRLAAFDATELTRSVAPSQCLSANDGILGAPANRDETIDGGDGMQLGGHLAWGLGNWADSDAEHCPILHLGPSAESIVSFKENPAALRLVISIPSPPTSAPTQAPTTAPTTAAPSNAPSAAPSTNPTLPTPTGPLLTDAQLTLVLTAGGGVCIVAMVCAGIIFAAVCGMLCLRQDCRSFARRRWQKKVLPVDWDASLRDSRSAAAAASVQLTRFKERALAQARSDSRLRQAGVPLADTDAANAGSDARRDAVAKELQSLCEIGYLSESDAARAAEHLDVLDSLSTLVAAGIITEADAESALQ